MRHSAYRDPVTSPDTTSSTQVQQSRRRSLTNDGQNLCSNFDLATCIIDMTTNSAQFTPGVHGGKSGKIVVTQW
jgi:hypothetical protein